MRGDFEMSKVDFGSEIIEIKNHTAAMMQVITSIRQDSSRRFNEMENHSVSVLHCLLA